jgi:hypothetical protein
MLRQIRLSFRLIPCEVHLRVIHTIICIHNSTAVIFQVRQKRVAPSALIHDFIQRPA